MANYSVTNTTAVGGGQAQVNIAAAYTTQLSVSNTSANGGTTANVQRRGKVYDLLVGTQGTPADLYVEWDVMRTITGSGGRAGSISSLSSNFGLDPADGSFAAFVWMNSSSETGITAVTQCWYVGVNQRASYRWVAAPGSEIVYPANSSGTTTTNGVAVRARGSAVVPATVTMLFQEQ